MSAVTSGIGTFETCRLTPRMSVIWGRPEVVRQRPKWRYLPNADVADHRRLFASPSLTGCTDAGRLVSLSVLATRKRSNRLLGGD
jgi:hypothetical protein